MILKMLLATLVVTAAIPVYCQVVPEATGAGLPLTFGVGYSNYYTDWSGRLSGPMFWADWNFYQLPSYLQGIGIEVEARDLNYDRTGSFPTLRMDTAGGGPIYTLRRYRRFQPYAKFLVSFGSFDFTIPGYPNYTHDTRTLRAPGGGLNCRVFQKIWVRGDYEYQFWPLLGHGNTLNPQGWTLGVAYNFRGRDAR
jgi:opacity protein-like surface antigen